ncbi:MAG TPA: hypothetical protein VHW02_07265 [Rhizomicrobium sp.]|nr:hypothetical protein [Rhizomicrobium sp.]
MANQRTFGRRPSTQTPVRPIGLAYRQTAPAQTLDEVRVSPPAHTVLPHIDIELDEWKNARDFRIPWRPLYLMASLCFGIASFALPSSINNNIDYLLYGLMAASFYAGVKKRQPQEFVVQPGNSDAGTTRTSLNELGPK